MAIILCIKCTGTPYNASHSVLSYNNIIFTLHTRGHALLTAPSFTTVSIDVSKISKKAVADEILVWCQFSFGLREVGMSAPYSCLSS